MLHSFVEDFYIRAFRTRHTSCYQHYVDSAKILAILRFLILTRVLPYCPAILIPLKTREGSEALPIEPGARSRLC